MNAARTMGRWLRRILGYGLCFLLSFGVTLYYSFPYDVIGQRILRQVEDRFGAKIEVGALSPYWLTGLSAEAISITLPAKRPGKEDLQIAVDALRARLRPLASLLGPLSVAVEVQDQAASLSGDIEVLDEGRLAAVLRIERLSLGELGALWDRMGLGFAGEVQGDLAVELPSKTPVTLDGTLSLSVKEGKFGGGMVKGFTVPGIRLGDFEIAIAAEKGRLELAPPIEIHSDDLAAEISGTVDLRPMLATSRANLSLRARPTDTFWKANATLAGLAKAMLENAKDGEGYYAYDLTGSLGRPSFSPHRGPRGRRRGR